jgi:hypothetical protein
VHSLRDEYVTRIGAFAAVKTCRAHDGELDDAEVARVGAPATPAVLVTCLGAPTMLDELGASAARFRWVAVVIARASDAIRDDHDSSGDVAAAIALRVAWELVHGAGFEHGLERPSDVRVANLIGRDAAHRGYALWAVTWEQPTPITPEGLEAVLDPFLHLHTDYDLPPTAGVDFAADILFEEEAP